MSTQTLPFSRFIMEEFVNSLYTLRPLLEDAYNQASLVGKRQSEDGSLTTRLLAPLESIRLSDAQGEFVQDHLHRWGGQHQGIESGFDVNRRKRNHVVVRTKRALLTAHRVPNPSSFPPSARYRQSNAQQNILWLPGLAQREKTGDAAYLFLLHGPSTSDPSQLGFIRLAMPNPEEKGYLAYHDIFMHTDFSISSKVEEIQDTALITLKVNRKETSDAS